MKSPLEISFNNVLSQNSILIVINEKTPKWSFMPCPIIHKTEKTFGCDFFHPFIKYHIFIQLTAGYYEYIISMIKSTYNKHVYRLLQCEIIFSLAYTHYYLFPMDLTLNF